MGRKKLPTLPKYLLAIDPAKAAGFALFVDRKLTQYGAVDGSTWRGMADTFRIAVADRPPQPGDSLACVIEDGYIARPFNAKGVLTLGRRRGLAQGAAEYAGFDDFHYIGPSTWQNTLFGYLAGRDTKELSLAYVAANLGVTGVTNDVSDAICLGLYYLQSLDLELRAQ